MRKSGVNRPLQFDRFSWRVVDGCRRVALHTRKVILVRVLLRQVVSTKSKVSPYHVKLSVRHNPRETIPAIESRRELAIIFNIDLQFEFFLRSWDMIVGSWTNFVARVKTTRHVVGVPQERHEKSRRNGQPRIYDQQSTVARRATIGSTCSSFPFLLRRKFRTI